MSLKGRVRRLTALMEAQEHPRRQYLRALMEYIRVKREARRGGCSEKEQEAAALRVRLEEMNRGEG